ncbi:hypothetical protein PMAYCL1PPCAC_33480, partial [Pristionchus mayeri]
IWSELNHEVKAEYGQTYKNNFKKAWNSGVKFAASSNLDWVVSHYEYALFSYWPRTRYNPGWDSLFLFVPLSMLPTFFQDAVLAILYK